MSSPPSASSACPTSPAVAVASDRLHGRMMELGISFCAASSASTRVPDSATFAPASASAFATAPPMPPEAPVTSANLPVRLNMSLTSPPLVLTKVRTQGRSRTLSRIRAASQILRLPQLPPWILTFVRMSGIGQRPQSYPKDFANASRSAGTFSATVAASGALRFTMPDSCLPAPVSTNIETPPPPFSTVSAIH